MTISDQISDREMFELLGRKEAELYLANKSNQELAAALKAAKAALEEAQAQQPHNEA